MRGREIDLKNFGEGEIGYIFGLFEGDGYKIYQKKSRHYNVEFYLNSKRDKEIIKRIVLLLKRLNLNPSEYQDKRFNCKRIRVYSKALFNIIFKNIDLDKKSSEFNLGFVSGLIDSEGYVNRKNYTIEIVNTNKNILNQCANFLDSINIKSHTSKRKRSIKDKKDSYRMYISVSFKRLKHLSVKVAGNFG
jgi:hypothetical protein